MVLRKTDPKHFRYTLDVVADDKNIEKKDKTVGEPIQFYVRGARAPYEIVVFDIGKDQAKGYLSTPKSASATPPAGKNRHAAGTVVGVGTAVGQSRQDETLEGGFVFVVRGIIARMGFVPDEPRAIRPFLPRGSL